MAAVTPTIHRSNPGLMKEIQGLGAFDVSACYSCGTCTSVCPLSDGKTIFPRKLITYVQLGLEDKLLQSADPWLCYYCGECTDSCPRKADPAGFMMATRRWLTTKYDFTGISKALYRSHVADWIGIALLSFIAALFIYLLHGPIVTSTVALATFAPVDIVETGDIVILGVLSAFLLVNVFRMYYYTVYTKTGKEISFTTYLKELFIQLPINFLTQYKIRSCTPGDNRDWFSHWTRFAGYALLFVLAVFLMYEWQTDQFYPLWSPIMLIQYVAAGLFFFGLSAPLYGRIKKTKNMYKYSHATDWMFLLMLLATGVTGVLIVIFRYALLPWDTYIIYSVHLMLVTSLLVLEVPFAKWSHMAYRTFAPYFARLAELKEVGEAV